MYVVSSSDTQQCQINVHAGNTKLMGSYNSSKRPSHKNHHHQKHKLTVQRTYQCTLTLSLTPIYVKSTE